MHMLSLRQEHFQISRQARANPIGSHLAENFKMLQPVREHMWFPCRVLRAGKPMYVPTLREHF